MSEIAEQNTDESYEALSGLKESLRQALDAGDMKRAGSIRAEIEPKLANIKEEIENEKKRLAFYPRELATVENKKDYHEVCKIPTPGIQRCVEILSDGRVATGSDEGKVTLWTVSADGNQGNGYIWHQLPLDIDDGTRGPIFTLQEAPDGDIVYTRSGKVNVLKNSGIIDEWYQHLGCTVAVNGAIYALQVLPDGQIITGDNNQVIMFLKKESLIKTDGYNAGETIRDLQVLPDGSFIVDYFKRGSIVWERNNESTFKQRSIASDEAHQVMSDGKVVCASGGRFRFMEETYGKWQEAEGFEIDKFDVQDNFITKMRVLPGKRVVAGDSKGNIYFCSKDEGEWNVKVLQGHKELVTGIQVLTDGRIISISEDETMRIWDGDKVEK
ncbi:MAG: hypothetical protein Q7S53_05295 [bacterium]|nr:hypothetical protein [bacterium]